MLLAQRDEEVRATTAWLLDPAFSGAYRPQAQYGVDRTLKLWLRFRVGRDSTYRTRAAGVNTYA
jgi:hypothetical protein